MQFLDDQESCVYPTSEAPSPSPSHSSIKNLCTRYYQEIGAEMLGNQLIIRVEKDKNKSKRKQTEWEPPCDCIEIQRPTKNRGPKVINADYDDRVVFRVHSPPDAPKKEAPAYKSQTIAYKVSSCRKETDSHQCKTITVYPRFNGSEEVYSNHITEGDEDIFLLRVKKKTESDGQRSRNVELELRTPKPPTPPPTPPSIPSTVEVQPVVDVIVEDKTEPDIITEPTKKPKKKRRRKR